MTPKVDAVSGATPLSAFKFDQGRVRLHMIWLWVYAVDL
jgi:hypothetical protein